MDFTTCCSLFVAGIIISQVADTNGQSDAPIRPTPAGWVSIILGSDALEGKYPWQVFIELDHGIDQCGGVLIDDRWILSAAHCFHGRTATKILIGTINRKGDDEAVMRTAKRACCHEDYVDSTWENDVCLLELSAAVTTSTLIKPITLPTANYDLADGTECTITGWGFTEHDLLPDILQKATVKLINRKQCESGYRKYGVDMPKNHFCAGHTEGGSDTCRGDSGGPLTCSGRRGEIMYGITSFGPEICGEKGTPGAYTKVSKYIDWISETQARSCQVYSWAPWTLACTEPCGPRRDIKRRNCLDETGAVVETEKCDGPASKVEQCNRQSCAVYHWGPWKITCSVTCGRGVEKRARECLDNNNVAISDTTKCSPGKAIERGECTRQDCVKYQWGPWTAGGCSITCGSGTMSRTRRCLDNRNVATNDVRRCRPGTDTQRTSCSRQDCVVYHWGPWKTTCSVTCGSGVETRARECFENNNVATSDTKCSPGRAIERGDCTRQDCVVYQWGPWTAGGCSVTCGSGTISRTRRCLDSKNVGTPDISKCRPGRDTQRINCSRQDCVGHNWGPWRTTCSVTCGGGIQTRRRLCYDDNGSIVSDNSKCGPEPNSQRGSCNLYDCAKYHWGPWATGSCSVTCGRGVVTRTRSCLDKHNARVLDTKRCGSGSDTTRTSCASGDCRPIIASHWGPWRSSCSVTCGRGIETRQRDCLDDNKIRISDPRKCSPGREFEIVVCSREDCPSGYSWSQWRVECSVTCGVGLETGRRDCLDGNNKVVRSRNCRPGVATRRGICRREKCSEYRWGPWKKTCSVTCGQGAEFATRDCLNQDGRPVNRANQCRPGNPFRTGICRQQACPVVTGAYTWGNWETWSACRVPFGARDECEGIQQSSRTCRYRSRVVAGSLCGRRSSGDFRSRPCTPDYCEDISSISDLLGI